MQLLSDHRIICSLDSIAMVATRALFAADLRSIFHYYETSYQRPDPNTGGWTSWTVVNVALN